MEEGVLLRTLCSSAIALPCGGGVGRGWCDWQRSCSNRATPTPNPSPQGQGNRIWVNKYESLTERTESKSSEIPVLFTHMRLPCPVGGGWPSEARPGGGGSLLRVALEAKTPPDPPRCARRATLPLQGRDDELAAPLGGCPAVMRAPRRTPPAA